MKESSRAFALRARRRAGGVLVLAAVAVGLILLSSRVDAGRSPQEDFSADSHLGFDLNIFPGEPALPTLRKIFAFSGYWLSPPPGEKTNTWIGRRDALRSQGFGFLLLYLGPASRDLKTVSDAREKGSRDGRTAAAAAETDRFPRHSIIFLDIEEGGRLPAAYHAYLRAWSEGLADEGYRAGAYCSGMVVREGPNVTITTADDIRAHAPSRDFAYFVFNDACPPSPGCVFPRNPPSPRGSGIQFASVWQFAQSPRRKKFTAHCPPGYNADGNCYAPGDRAHTWFLDVNSASTADPSNGR